MTQETTKKEFELIFGLQKTEQDRHGYLGFRPSVLVEDVWNWHISQLQSVFEEIEKKRIREGLENNDLIGEEVKIYNQAVEDVLSLRQKYIPGEKEGK